MTERTGRILVVDDVRENVRLLESRQHPISCCSTC